MSSESSTHISEEFSIDWLDYHAKHNADSIAVVDLDTDRRYTYQAFNARLKRLAAGLKQQFGIAKGDRVALLAHNSSDTFETLFACWEIGAALLPLNWRLSAHEISMIINHAEPSVVIFDDEFSHLLEGVNIPKLGRGTDAGVSEYEKLIAASKFDFTPAHLSIDDLSTLLYTSGTTGMPKGVIGNFRMMRDTIIHAALHGEVNSSARSLTCVPFFHCAGLYGFSMPLFHYGGTLHVMKKWEPVRFLSYLTDPQLGITHSIGVPVQYQMMAELPQFKNAVFPTLRVAGVGAAPISMNLLETWAAKGVNLSQSYGLTEAFSVAFLPSHQARAKIGSAGHRMMHTQLQIGDEHGEKLPTGTVGEIQIKGPAVTPGYWKAPEETGKTFVNGWFRTGDAGRVEADGIIYIVDRLKDMFISGGENVYPAEIENALTEISEVAAAAVVGVDDARWGQVGLAVVQLKHDKSLDEGSVQAFCKRRLAGYKIPKYFRFVSSLPMSAQGKILKNELRRMYDPTTAQG